VISKMSRSLRPVGRSPVIAGRAIAGEAGAPGGRPATKEAARRLLPYPWHNNNGAIRTSIPAGWLSPTAVAGIVGDVEDTERDPEDNVATANSPPAIHQS
jgi:hypothetical protein